MAGQSQSWTPARAEPSGHWWLYQSCFLRDRASSLGGVLRPLAQWQSLSQHGSFLDQEGTWPTRAASFEEAKIGTFRKGAVEAEHRAWEAGSQLPGLQVQPESLQPMHPARPFCSPHQLCSGLSAWVPPVGPICLPAYACHVQKTLAVLF